MSGFVNSFLQSSLFGFYNFLCMNFIPLLSLTYIYVEYSISSVKVLNISKISKCRSDKIVFRFVW